MIQAKHEILERVATQSDLEMAHRKSHDAWKTEKEELLSQLQQVKNLVADIEQRHETEKGAWLAAIASKSPVSPTTVPGAAHGDILNEFRTSTFPSASLFQAEILIVRDRCQ